VFYCQVRNATEKGLNKTVWNGALEFLKFDKKTENLGKFCHTTINTVFKIEKYIKCTKGSTRVNT